MRIRKKALKGISPPEHLSNNIFRNPNKQNRKLLIIKKKNWIFHRYNIWKSKFSINTVYDNPIHHNPLQDLSNSSPLSSIFNNHSSNHLKLKTQSKPNTTHINLTYKNIQKPSNLSISVCRRRPVRSLNPSMLKPSTSAASPFLMPDDADAVHVGRRLHHGHLHILGLYPHQGNPRNRPGTCTVVGVRSAAGRPVVVGVWRPRFWWWWWWWRRRCHCFWWWCRRWLLVRLVRCLAVVVGSGGCSSFICRIALNTICNWMMVQLVCVFCMVSKMLLEGSFLKCS